MNVFGIRIPALVAALIAAILGYLAGRRGLALPMPGAAPAA